MNRRRLPIAAGGAVIAACLLAGPAQALPAGNLAPAAAALTSVQTVQWVCDAWGRCWRQPNFYYRSFAPVVVAPRVLWGGPVYRSAWVGPGWVGPGWWGYRGGWYGRRWW
jgi:hypothetical protein